MNRIHEHTYVLREPGVSCGGAKQPQDTVTGRGVSMGEEANPTDDVIDKIYPPDLASQALTCMRLPLAVSEWPSSRGRSFSFQRLSNPLPTPFLSN